MEEYPNFFSNSGENLNELIFFIREAPFVFVIDASVCIKWFVSPNEKFVVNAKKLRQDLLNKRVLLIAPDLLLYEVSNALSYNTNLTKAAVIEAIKSLNLMNIKYVKPLEQILKITINLKFLKNITVYDAIYLGLAKFVNAQLLTADEKLYNSVKELGYVVLLSEYSIL